MSFLFASLSACSVFLQWFMWRPTQAPQLRRLFYVLITISMHYVLAIITVTRPRYLFIPVLEYAPVIIAFMLWIIEDCSRLSMGGAPCLLPWRWGSDIDDQYSATTDIAPTSLHGSRSSFGGSMGSDCQVKDDDDDTSVLSTPDSLIFRFWSPVPSRAPSSRLSDISLSSTRPESLPSSWGLMTRVWFPEYTAQGQRQDEPNYRTECQNTSRTV
ncbi:hypothetical protein F4808DRAFT_165490 [Astrocystis sublimbata]|nr:hypothetical protein F4808DRAFT_165490 [Astrocystis sublimbata]